MKYLISESQFNFLRYRRVLFTLNSEFIEMMDGAISGNLYPCDHELDLWVELFFDDFMDMYVLDAIDDVYGGEVDYDSAREFVEKVYMKKVIEKWNKHCK
jgi:hypothetical protein